MNYKTIHLAKQILGTVPKAEVEGLIELLTYYNSRFQEGHRALAMEVGGEAGPGQDRVLEQRIVENLGKSLGSQNVYMASTRDVCKLCGK